MAPTSRKRRRPDQADLKDRWDAGDRQGIFHCGPCSHYGFTTKGGKDRHFDSEVCGQNHARGDTSVPLTSSFVMNSNNTLILASNVVDEVDTPLMAKRQRK